MVRSAIIPPEVNGFGWNLGHSEYIVRSWPWQILGAIHTEARVGEWGKVFFCQVHNAWLYRFPVSQISRNLHTRRGSERWWILLEANFENLPTRGLFFQKGNFWVTILNVLGFQAAIFRKWLQIVETHDRLASQRNVGFPFIPLESTRSHSPGLQDTHKERHSWTSLALLSSTRNVISHIHSRGGVTTPLHCDIVRVNFCLQ